MNLLGRELTTLEKILSAVALVAGVFFGFQYFARKMVQGGMRPSQVKRETAAEAGKLEKNLNDLNKLRKDLRLGAFKLPPTTESPEVYSFIRQTAKESGLAFTSLPATAPQKGKGFQTIGYKFTSKSELKSVIKFVDAVQSGEYLVCLESWEMKPEKDRKMVETILALNAYFQREKSRTRR